MSFNNPFRKQTKKDLQEYFEKQKKLGIYSDNLTLKEKAEYVLNTYGENTLASNFAKDVLKEIV